MLPICDVRVLGPKSSVSQRVLIDSGAVYSVFPRKTADDAGISLLPYPNHVVQFGSSTVYGRRTPVHLVLRGLRWSADVVFVDRLEFPYGLLGRYQVFTQFNEIAFLEKIAVPSVELRW